MALVLSGSIDISGSMTATTILISSPGAAGMVSSSAQITELAPLMAYTASLKGAAIVSSSAQITELVPLMAYTASLKGAAIVSSSQQVQNYFTFAQTASANTFYGNQSISGSVGVNKSSNGGSGNDFPRLKVQNSLPTQGDGSTTFNFADILISSGNEAVNMFLATTYAAGTWAPSGIINVATNHGLQIKTNNATAVNVAAGGDVTVSTGNLVIGTAGKGIDFSATSNSFSGSMTSELLNDYEEGTWTPVISDGTNNATMTATYNRGQYVKVGRQVTLTAYVLTDSLGSVTGNIRIAGIPFINGSGYGYIAGGVVGNAAALNITAGHNITTTISTGADYLTLNVWDDATGATAMQASEWSSNGQIQMTITYLTDY